MNNEKHPQIKNIAFHGVLFDLDGTLLDTAQDMIYAINCIRKKQGMTEMAYETLRPFVSHGSIAMVKKGLSITPETTEFKSYQQDFLDIYQDNIARKTRLFKGMDNVLSKLENNNIPWGIVTNKPAWLTDPLLELLGLDKRAACTVSGDTLDNRKPHPEPMLYACKKIDVIPSQCLYVGDAKRDIDAGNNAGITSIIASFGYIGEYDDIDSWNSAGIVNTPEEILNWVFV